MRDLLIQESQILLSPVNFHSVMLERVGNNVILHLQMEGSKLADVQLQNLPETCSDQQGILQHRAQASGYQCHPAFPSKACHQCHSDPRQQVSWFWESGLWLALRSMGMVNLNLILSAPISAPFACYTSSHLLATPYSFLSAASLPLVDFYWHWKRVTIFFRV